MTGNFEGSVNMEGLDDSSDEEQEQESSENIKNSEDESSDENQDVDEKSDENQEDNQDQDETKLTDKGTKLDPNPKSAVYQQLANAKARNKDINKFMQDPKQVRKYLADLEEELGKKTGESQEDIQDKAEEENLITDPSKIETKQDLQSYAKYLNKRIEKSEKSLLQERESFKRESSEKAIAERLSNDITTLQGKYSFLNPKNSDGTKNPDYDEQLEKEIADAYSEMDKNPKTGKYLGRFSITKVAERFIRIRNLGEVTGGKKAQETVIDKRRGAVKTSSNQSSNASGESKMSASEVIASRMAKARGNR